MYKYIFLVFIFVFTGCSSNNMMIKDSQKEETFTTKEFMNISKDAIFEATKKIFITAGKKEFRIDSYRNSLVVSRTKMHHYPFYAVTDEVKWILSIEETNNLSSAKLEILKIVDYNEEDIQYMDKKSHELIWSRIDYLLGLSDDWFDCSNYYGPLSFDNGLCDSVDLPRPIENKNIEIVEDILIADREGSKSVLEIDEDILKDDISFTIEDSGSDILDKDDKIELESKDDVNIDESLEKEINNLDKKVNINIDETLNKIEDNIEDEIPLDKNK